MKQDIHPEYREVVFQDTSTGDQFIIKSTIQTKETCTVKGKEYPLHKVSISSKSHPFFTGAKSHVDSAGRIQKFNQRFAKKPVQEPEVKKVEAKADEKKAAPKKAATKAAAKTAEKKPAVKKVAAKKAATKKAAK
ncbi:MAG: hypothetical protein S4CHLAM102_09510 [Chlamydiia bacterium]|nr:hypothetical protein [Chlamydiia bacterium]